MFSFTFRVTLADAMHSMDIPCDSGSLTRMFPFPVSHVSLCYLFWIDDSSVQTRLPYAYSLVLRLPPFGLSTRLSTRYFWTLTRLRLISPFTNSLYLYLAVSSFTIYTVGDGDLFPIFNLLCNHPKGVTCEIPRTLLVLSSSLAKATALRLLGFVLCLLAYR